MLLNKKDIPRHPWLVEFQNHTRHESLEWENSPIFILLVWMRVLLEKGMYKLKSM